MLKRAPQTKKYEQDHNLFQGELQRADGKSNMANMDAAPAINYDSNCCYHRNYSIDIRNGPDNKCCPEIYL